MKTFREFLNEAKSKFNGTNKEKVRNILIKHNFTVTDSTNMFGELIVYCPEIERSDTIKKISQLFNTEIKYDVKSIRNGYVAAGDTRIQTKPSSSINKKGDKSAGVDNEFIIVDLINKICDYGNTPSTIKFIADNTTAKGSKKSFKIKNVISAVRSGGDTKGRKKADIMITCLDSKGNPKDIPISIKKDNAENWESGDTLFRNFITDELEKLDKQKRIIYLETNKFPRTGAPEHLKSEVKKHIANNKIVLIKGNKDNGISYYKVFPELKWSIPKNIKRNVMFGSDIKDNYGCILQKTFSTNENVNIIKDGKNNVTYEIKVSHIYTKVKDAIDAHDAYILLRNDSTRPNGVVFKGLSGLRVVASYSKRAKNAKLMN